MQWVDDGGEKGGGGSDPVLVLPTILLEDGCKENLRGFRQVNIAGVIVIGVVNRPLKLAGRRRQKKWKRGGGGGRRRGGREKEMHKRNAP